MARLMSVTHTEQSVIDRTKRVTRRAGWVNLTAGDRLTLCRKVMGRKRRDGSVEPLVRLAEVEVVDVRRERLDAIAPDDVVLEGVFVDTVPLTDPRAFIEFFVGRMGGRRDQVVTRIEWRYLDADIAWDAITGHRFRFVDELELHEGLHHVFAEARLPVAREVQLTRGRIDFMIGRVGLEVKVVGGVDQVRRQLTRYACDVDELLLVTTKPSHAQLGGFIADVPCRVLVVRSGAW